MNETYKAKQGYDTDLHVDLTGDQAASATGAGDTVNPTAEDTYWASVHADQPFARADLRFDDYLPAYRIGYVGAKRFTRMQRSFDDVEPTLEAEYERTKGHSALVWEQAKLPARAAWDRVAGASAHVPR